MKHHAVQLARVLRQQGHHVTLLGASSREQTDPHTFGIGGIVNIPSNGSDNKLALCSGTAIRRFFRDRTFDVVHVHEPPVPAISYWTAWLTPGLPKMSTFHAFAESPPLGLRVLQKMFGAIQNPFFDHAVAVSPPAARYASAAWDRPMPIVPNGIPIDLFTPALRRATPRLTRRVLAIGRLSDERKGIVTAIEAHRILRQRDPSWTLDVVGEDPSSPKLPQIPGLTFHAPLPLKELIERYRDCDVFAAPSTSQESFGIVLLEAMATGKPIVCSDIEGYRHVADANGAMFVPPRDAGALADALDDLMDDEARRRAMSAFNLAYVRRFDWSVVAHRIVREYLVTIENYRVRRGLAPLGLVGRWSERRVKPEAHPHRVSDVGDRLESETSNAAGI